MVDWLSLSVPFAYLSILVGSLMTFSSIYRKRKAASAVDLEPWFPPHTTRNIYLSLLHLQDDPNQKKVPESILKAALLRRAEEDIRRILQIRTSKPALTNLLQRGSVGDDLWQRFSRAEKEVEEEVKDVVQEANAFADDWGQTIFQSANEMNNNATLRKNLDAILARLPAEKDAWEKKRTSVREDFLKEVGADSGVEKAPVPPPSKDGGPKPPLPQAAVAGEPKSGSEDDAVLVDAGGPTAGGAAKSKKKKAKK